MAKEFLVGSRCGTFSIVGYYTYCDNSGAVANAKEPRSHKRGKHIERKYHLLRREGKPDCIRGQPSRSFYKRLDTEDL